METEEGLEAAASLGISSQRRQRAPMHHEPIYHMYIECKADNEEDADGETEIEHMDIMYSRWSVQNPVLLRQRILERMGTEVLVKEMPQIKNSNKFAQHMNYKKRPL